MLVISLFLPLWHIDVVDACIWVVEWFRLLHYISLLDNFTLFLLHALGLYPAPSSSASSKFRYEKDKLAYEGAWGEL